MPQIMIIGSALLVLVAAAAVPAAADHRGKGDGYKTSPQAEHRERVKKREARSKHWKRYRYGHHRYAYPYTRWWGPFAGPPGL